VGNNNSSRFQMQFGPQALSNKTLDGEATYEYPRLIWTAFAKHDTIRRGSKLHLLREELCG